MRFNDASFFDGSHAVKANGTVIQPYDGSLLYNIRPAFEKVELTIEGGENVSWEGGVATVTHSLGCYPVVAIYDSDGELVYPNLTVLSGTSFSLDFQTDYCPIQDNETWICVILFGAVYGSGSGGGGGSSQGGGSSISYENGNATVSGSYRQEITSIPASTSQYMLGEGIYSHVPSTSPTYVLPAVSDATVTHESILTVRFSSNALSCEFEDSQGNTLVPSPVPQVQAGSVVTFRCTYESLLGSWAVLAIPIGIVSQS